VQASESGSGRAGFAVSYSGLDDRGNLWRSKKIVFYNSVQRPQVTGCAIKRFETTRTMALRVRERLS
jgi:hypothetical protein